MTTRKVIEVFYFDAGGGHRSAMNALTEILAERHPAWQINPVDLQEVLQPIDLVYKITEKIPLPLRKLLRPVVPKIADGPVYSQEMYNAAIKRGKTLGWGAILVMFQMFIETHAPRIESLLRKRWQDPNGQTPDLIVSLIPNFNRRLFRALKKVHPHVPYVTIMTDMMDIPPHFWMEHQDQHLICGTKASHAQARKTRFYSPQKLYLVSGMILRESFYQKTEPSLTHASIGFRKDVPTVLIMFGGNGSLVAEKIVTQLENAKYPVQAIVMCGKNHELYTSLKEKTRCHPVGFTTNVAAYMRLADIFIGKPGPGCISEAIHLGLPVIVELNAASLPQERPNAEWIVENGIGISTKSFQHGVARQVRKMIADLDAFRANIRKNIPENMAIYEIADILGHIVEKEPAVVKNVRDNRAGESGAIISPL